MDWLMGKFTGNHRFSQEIWDFPVNFPLNQPIEVIVPATFGKISGATETSNWFTEQ